MMHHSSWSNHWSVPIAIILPDTTGGHDIWVQREAGWIYHYKLSSSEIHWTTLPPLNTKCYGGTDRQTKTNNCAAWDLVDTYAIILYFSVEMKWHVIVRYINLHASYILPPTVGIQGHLCIYNCLMLTISTTELEIDHETVFRKTWTRNNMQRTVCLSSLIP